MQTYIGPRHRANGMHMVASAFGFEMRAVIMRTMFYILCIHILCINSNKQNVRVRPVFRAHYLNAPTTTRSGDDGVYTLWNFLLKSFYIIQIFCSDFFLFLAEHARNVPHREYWQFSCILRAMCMYSIFSIRCVCVSVSVLVIGNGSVCYAALC